MSIASNTLVHEFTVDTVNIQTDIDTYTNVIKRREQIIYRSSLPTNSANIAFIGGGVIDSENNLSIADRSTSLPANRIVVQNSTFVSGTKTFTINTENFVVTDVFVTQTETITEDPLYYKHTLSEDLVPRDSNGNLDTGVTIRDIQILDTFLQSVKVSDILIDYTTGIIYNNLTSEYNNSSDYTAYYVKYTVNNNGDVATHIKLLNNETVYRIAEFSDLDSFLQIKTDGRKVYLIEESAGEYEVTLPTASPPQGSYAFLPLSSSQIEIVPPIPSEVDESWFIRVTNGKFFTTVGSNLYKYHIAEFLNQAFYPEPPVRAVGSENSSILGKTLIKLDHENIHQDSAQELYVNIQINDAAGTGKAAFTTNPSLTGDVAANGQIWTQWTNATRYGIKSIDYRTGFVDIEGLQMKTSWETASSYYYAEDKYEFTLVNFNPISNRDLLGQKIVLFIDPDTTTSSKTQTLYYLKVDRTGKIVESDWPDFDNDVQAIPGSPNIPVYYERYPSWKPYENHVIFRDQETTEVSGIYLILGDVTVAPVDRPEGLSTLDSRRRGGGIVDTAFNEVSVSNPEAIWVWDEGYWDGIPYPGNASYLVEVPADIFDGGDGVFLQQEVKDIIDRHTAGGVYPVVKAYGVDVTISGVIPAGNEITILWSSDEH